MTKNEKQLLIAVGPLRLFIFTLLIFSSVSTFSQEICNNGIDDDANGLIDLNDSIACQCLGIGGIGANVTSLIPNPSFESTNCCPTIISQMNCANGWIQASTPTTDYLNTCGFLSAAQNTPSLLPFANGNGCVAAIFRTGWQEFVGACLLSPMLAGQSYTIQMNMGASTFDGWDDTCNGGNIFFGPVDITLYGSTNCSNMPYNGTACPPAPAWEILGSATYTPTTTWSLVNVTFTPTVDIYALIIGGPCPLPPIYDVMSCFPYIYFDNLILNTTTSFNTVNIATTGSNCLNNIVLNSAIDTIGGTWQWFKDGIALAGQTGSSLNLSSGGFGNGVFTALYSLGPDCEMISQPYNYILPTLAASAHSHVTCYGGTDGSAQAIASGGSGSFSYEWNSFPVQVTPSAINLPAGTYTVTATDNSGCSVTNTVTITESPQIITNNVQSICAGDSYSINSQIYSTAGIYYDTLPGMNGCDSIVITDLTLLSILSGNNFQTICTGDFITFNSHIYSTAGIYYDTITALTGCDSVVVTHLFVNPVFTSNNPVSLCPGESYVINGHVYFATGNYFDTMSTTLGCDSVIITQLFLNENYAINNLQSICQGESYNINSHDYTASGIYNDTLRTVFGCDSVIITQLAVKPLPVLSFSQMSPVCIDTSVIDLAFALPTGGLYNGAGVMNNTFNAQAATAGTHRLTYFYTDPLTNCENSISEDITVHPLPVPNSVIEPHVTFLENSQISFFDYTPGIVRWYWDFGDNTSSTTKEGFHVYRDTGHYEINLEITDINGCKNQSSDIVFISENFSFFIPNAFTPNGDGKNDIFNGLGRGIQEYDLVILNRWGRTIFSTNQMHDSWSAEEVPEGVYIYKVSLKDAIGSKHEYIGSVSVIR